MSEVKIIPQNVTNLAEEIRDAFTNGRMTTVKAFGRHLGKTEAMRIALHTKDIPYEDVSHTTGK